MPRQRERSLSHRREPTLHDLGFALAWLLSFVLLLPVQLASMILFDSTGLDVLAPDLVFMAAVPALALALLPTLTARHRYSRRTVRFTAGVTFTALALVAAYTTRFYGTCGPGC